MDWLEEIRASIDSPLAHPLSTMDAKRLLAIAQAAQKLVEAYEASRFTLMPRLEYEELRALLAALAEGEKT